MGALDTLNSSGAGITTTNGVLPESSIPTDIARDSEVPTVAPWAQNNNAQIADSAIPSDIARDSEIPTNNNQLTNGAGYITSAPSPGNGRITLNAGTNLTGGGNFTVNQSGNQTITFNASGGVPSGGVSGTVITNIGYNPGNVSLGSANPSVAGTSGSFDAGSPLVLNFSRTFGGVNSGHNILTGTWRPTNSRARYGGNTFTYDTWIRVS